MKTKFKKFFVSGDYFILKIILVLITAISAGVAFDSDIKYMNIFDRTIAYLNGIPEFDLIAEDQDDSGSLLLLNDNNSPVFIYSVYFVPTKFEKEKPTPVLPSTGGSAEFDATVEIKDFVKSNLEATVKPSDLDPIKLIPSINSPSEEKSLDEHYISEIGARDVRNLSFDIKTTDASTPGADTYILEGKLEITYYVHTTRKTISSNTYSLRIK